LGCVHTKYIHRWNFQHHQTADQFIDEKRTCQWSGGRRRFPSPKGGYPYGTCISVCTASGEVHRPHRRKERQHWKCAVTSTVRPRIGSGLIQQDPIRG
jgi:hypothetical protein